MSSAAAAAADTKSSTSRPYKIVLGADGYGAPLLDDIKTYLDQQQIQWEDVGIGKYYDIAAQVANEVAAGLPSVRGILCDGTGMGMAIVANKHAKIYAANVDTVEAAVNSRTINNSNILCLGGTTLEPSLAVTILSAWLNADVAAGWPSPVDEFIKESMNKIPHVIQQRLIHSPFAESESIHIDATTSSFEPVPGITGATWMVYRLQPFSALLRFPSGASQALHHHSYGHSIYIISGTQSFHDRTTNTKYELKQGSYLYTPAGHVFSVSYPSACEFLITSDGTFDMLWDTEATATASAAAAAAAAAARK